MKTGITFNRRCLILLRVAKKLSTRQEAYYLPCAHGYSHNPQDFTHKTTVLWKVNGFYLMYFLYTAAKI